MTQAKTSETRVFEEIELPNGKIAKRLRVRSLLDCDDSEADAEWERLEAECDPFGDYGYFARAFGKSDRPIKFRVRQDLSVEELECLERKRDFRGAIREALQNDPEIEDAEAFELKYFWRDRTESIEQFFADAANYETSEERMAKAREAIAVQKETISQSATS